MDELIDDIYSSIWKKVELVSRDTNMKNLYSIPKINMVSAYNNDSTSSKPGLTQSKA